MSAISPFIRTPFTDVTGGITSHQLMGRCAKQEMAYMDCLEAYGMDKGKRKCCVLFDDFNECHTQHKQLMRFYIMRAERERQIKSGKLTGDKKYVTPRVDSY